MPQGSMGSGFRGLMKRFDDFIQRKWQEGVPVDAGETEAAGASVTAENKAAGQANAGGRRSARHSAGRGRGPAVMLRSGTEDFLPRYRRSSSTVNHLRGWEKAAFRKNVQQ